MVLIGLAATVCLLTSCSPSSTKDRQRTDDDAAVSDDQTTEGADKEIAAEGIVARWELDPALTREAIRGKIRPSQVGGPLALNRVIKSLSESVLEFDLYADLSFECRQQAAGQSLEYRGNWSLDGDQVRLEQTHRKTSRGDVREADLMTGTIGEQSIDLLHHNPQLTIPYVFRLRQE
jgi:hypothetical protein